MFGVNITDYDKHVWEEKLDGFLPQKMIDIHVHLWEPGTRHPNRKGCVGWTQIVAPSQTYEDMEESYRQLFPGRSIAKIVMGSPSCDLDVVNAYVRKCVAEHGNHAYFCTNWDTTPAEIQRALNSGFIGIKPYQNNSPSYIPANELRIFDFLTHEQLEYMDSIGGIVMLHIPRSLRLRDPINVAQMLEIDERYPNAKVIIAHIGRAYVERDIGDAFDVLRRTKHLMFDFSANTFDLAMEKCIEAVGVGRLMFGSDMPFTKMRMYRIDDNGTYINVVPRGLYGDVSGDKNMRETDETEITLFMYEELLAFRRTAERLGLTREDINKIMYENASAYFGIRL